ncbi:MAG: endonuclease III, partial [Planctomycetes bacterium]|nr:endonuclease III [Planctomycetota bacterium]
MPKKSSKKLSSNKAPLKTKSGKVSQSKAQRSVVKPATESSKSLSDLKTQAGKVVKGLARTYADAVCALDHQTPFQLLAATILSAQCTDERVNMVTPELFRRWPDAGQLASASQSDVEEVVRSTGFFRAKAANLIGMAQGLVERYGGEVPRTIEELIVLPGVGRKTANVVLGT